MAMLGGSWYWQSERAKRKQLGEEARARAADEKKRAWIRELERRDVEDRAVRLSFFFLFLFLFFSFFFFFSSLIPGLSGKFADMANYILMNSGDVPVGRESPYHG